MRELREYQAAAIDEIFKARENGLNRVLIQMATGTGKTFVAAEMIARIREQDLRPVLCIAHRDELLTQAWEHIHDRNPTLKLAIEKGDQRATPYHTDVVIASIQSIAKEGAPRLKWLQDVGISMIWYDEAHHAPADGAGRLLADLGCFDERRTFLFGCTATPTRLDNRPLEGAGDNVTFQSLVYRYDIRQAVRDGWLCDLKGYRVMSGKSLDSVHTAMGDFNQKELNEVVNDISRTDLAIAEWMKRASDRSTVVFCASIEHAIETAARWEYQTGVKAEAVHAGNKDYPMPQEERRAIIDRFKNGQTQILVNRDIATEGFDHKPISCVVMLRPTKSAALYAQQIGRGTRTSPETGKIDCIVIDVTDNSTKHSLITLPSSLGMPANIDPDGESIFAIQDELEELGQTALNLPASVKPWRELVTEAQELNLLGLNGTVPDDAELAWVPSLGDSLTVFFADDDSEWKRRGVIERDALGNWVLRRTWMTEKGHKSADHVLDRETGRPVRYAEELLKRYWRSGMVIASKKAKWRRDPPTTAQLNVLSKWMKPYELDKIATKGEASNLINSYFSRGKRE